MAELKGILWRKLHEIKESRARKREKYKKEMEKLEKAEKISKSEDCGEEKLDVIVSNLETLNDLSKKIVKQNQEIIGLLRGKRKVVVSI